MHSSERFCILYQTLCLPELVNPGRVGPLSVYLSPHEPWSHASSLDRWQFLVLALHSLIWLLTIYQELSHRLGRTQAWGIRKEMSHSVFPSKSLQSGRGDKRFGGNSEVANQGRFELRTPREWWGCTCFRNPETGWGLLGPVVRGHFPAWAGGGRIFWSVELSLWGLRLHTDLKKRGLCLPQPCLGFTLGRPPRTGFGWGCEHLPDNFARVWIGVKFFPCLSLPVD